MSGLFAKAVATTIVCALILSASAARAQDPVDILNLDPEALFNATIMSVSKREEKVGDAPAAIFVLTNEDIKRSGATSIPEALRLVPGVNIARVNAGGWAISIRGFNSALANKLLVLIDGRQVYDRLFSGVYWYIQDSPLEDIERIEVIRGPGATLWGANAVNGVINILTKSSAKTHGGLLSVASGNQEHGLVTARYGGSIGDAGHYRLYSKYTNRGEETTLAGGDANDAWITYRGGFRTDWDLNGGRDSYTMQGDLYNSEISQFRNVPNTVVFPFFTTVQEDIEARGGNLLGRWTRNFDNSGQLQVQSYFDYTFRNQFTLKDRAVAADLDMQYVFPRMGRHEIVAGGGYQYAFSDTTQTAIITSPRADRGTQLFSSFIQDKITLQDDRWYLTLGTKLEHNDYTGFEVQPNARLQWHPSPNQMFWTSIARAVRTPSRLEHDMRIFSGVVTPFGPAIPIVVQLQPSPNFDSEELIAYEAGYRHQVNKDLSLDIAAFFNDYDKISTLTLQPAILAPPPITLPILFTNDTKAEVMGLETVVNWKARDNLTFIVAHTLLNMQLHGPPPAVAIGSELAEGQSPDSQLVLRAQWDVRDDLALDTIVYHTSALSGFAIDDYWRLDLNVNWRVTDNIELGVTGQNLLRDDHREFTPATDANATRINRSIFGKMTWRF